jgi:3-oxoacyl-[acyl-carrier-protein] synthase-3
MAKVAKQVMNESDLTPDNVHWLVPHQANKRIIEATYKQLNLNPDKVMVNIERYGNTTNATIPLCLWEWEDQLNKGDNLILAAFGGGFTWGATYMRWSY